VTGTLTSGKAKTGRLSFEGQHAVYTFRAVKNKHVTVAMTRPHVSPSGSNLQMQIYDASGGTDANGVLINTTTTEMDFTATSEEAGVTTVVISPYSFGATGSFTLTYAKDVTAKLTSGKAKTGRLRFEGQHVDYTFRAVTGKDVALAITRPHVSPPGSSLQMQVYDASGNTDANGVLINTNPTAIDFTPTAEEAGLTTVVISPYSFGATGSFTIKYRATRK
jgi:hypothetical protein